MPRNRGPDGRLLAGPPLSERFWANVDRRGSEECWPWKASLTCNGYGNFWDGKRMRHASQLAYELTKGPHKGLDVMHSCDNRPCCNPAHLSLGTRSDNMRDARLRGRTLTGERNTNSVLDEATVRLIPRLLSTGLFNQTTLAQFLGVKPHAISKINTGKRWRHVFAAASVALTLSCAGTVPAAQEVLEEFRRGIATLNANYHAQCDGREETPHCIVLREHYNRALDWLTAQNARLPE